MRFIYVFSDEDRDVLLNQGYTLMKEDNERHVYTFLNENLSFDKNEIKQYCFSDILTF